MLGIDDNNIFLQKIDLLISQNPAILYSAEADAQFTLTYISPNVEKILGWQRDLFLTDSGFWQTLLHPEEKDIVIKLHQKIFRNDSMNIEYRLRCKNGEYKWFSDKANLIRYDDRSPKELIGFITDIDDERNLKIELRKAHEKLRSIIDTIPGALIVYDNEQRIIDISDNASTIFGYKDKSEMLGKKCSEIFGCDQSDDCLVASSLLEGNMVTRFTSDYERFNFKGNYKVLTNPIKDEFGGIWGAIELLIDITDLKRAQEELRDLITALKIANKLSEDSNKNIQRLYEDLSKSEQELKELNMQKDKFFSIIAHDLKTPFQGFLGYTKLLNEEFDNLHTNEIKELTRVLKDSAETLYKLLENLLEWSRLQRGLTEFIPMELNLSNIVMMNFDIMNNPARHKDIRLYCDIPTNEFIFADPNMLNTILRNLISNAIKFTPIGGTISVSMGEPVGDRITVSVSDTGIGMNEETRLKLFQNDKHITTKGTNNESGTGLGLILCKELIEKDGGSIWVDSESGKGSTFSFTLNKFIMDGI